MLCWKLKSDADENLKIVATVHTPFEEMTPQSPHYYVLVSVGAPKEKDLTT